MIGRRLRWLLVSGLVLLALLLIGCGESIDSTPEKLDGSSSYEFEPDDIKRAESASPAVQEYCEGAVSEAQEVGCLSHVDESDIP